MKRHLGPGEKLDKVTNNLPRASKRTWIAAMAVVGALFGKDLYDNIDNTPYSEGQNGEPISMTCARENFKLACDGQGNKVWLSDTCETTTSRIANIANQSNISLLDAAVIARKETEISSKFKEAGTIREQWKCHDQNRDPYMTIEQESAPREPAIAGTVQ